MESGTKLDRFAAHRWFPAVVWTLRLVVGALFVMSGLVKGIDLWGFVFKLEEYLAVWGFSEPRSITVIGALLISGYEFVFGLLLATGCYKRVSVWALLLQMAVMLPLTLYIAIAEPVSDCGCFGDFWVISNTMTFVKNLLITAALVALLILNPRLKQGMFQPAIQWIAGAWISLYFIIVALYGYNVQPMVDFRPYPVGTPLIGADAGEAFAEEDADAEPMVFVYERDGQKQEFTMDHLPDSTWTFVERIGESPADDAGGHVEGAAFTVYDESGEDVTEEAITTAGREFLVVIPEPQRIDISYTYFLNELKEWADSSDVGMVALIAAGRREIDFIKDISMASYDIYSAEDTKLKELARGTMSLVELEDGRIKAKYTLSSIDGDILDAGPSGADLPERMAPRPQWWFKALTGFFAACLLGLYLFQSLILAINSRIRALYQKKRVNLQSENAGAASGAVSEDKKHNHNKLENNHEKEHRSR